MHNSSLWKENNTLILVGAYFPQKCVFISIMFLQLSLHNNSFGESCLAYVKCNCSISRRYIQQISRRYFDYLEESPTCRTTHPTICSKHKKMKNVVLEIVIEHIYHFEDNWFRDWTFSVDHTVKSSLKCFQTQQLKYRCIIKIHKYILSFSAISIRSWWITKQYHYLYVS